MRPHQTEPGGLGDKFRLLYSVSCDERASRSHAAVMGVLLWRYNRAHGCCWPSVESIAEDAGLDTRTAQRAVDALEAWDYLHVVRQRGKLNRYVPHFQACREPVTNGTRAGGEGRHPRPQGTTSASRSNGTHAVPPPARTPPEYLNESITEKEKGKGSFFLGGNQERGKADGTSEDSASPHGFAKGSPERMVEIGLGILRTSLALNDGRIFPDYQSRLSGVRKRYLSLCLDALKAPDPKALELLDEAERGNP